MDDNIIYQLLEDHIQRGDLNMDELERQIRLQAQRFHDQLAAKGNKDYHELDVSMYKYRCTFNIMLRVLSHKQGFTLKEHQRIIGNIGQPPSSNQDREIVEESVVGIEGAFENQILEETKESNFKEVHFSISTPIKKWTDAHLATAEIDRFEVLLGEMEEHLEGDYGFAIEEHHLFGESSKLPSSTILVQEELEHSLLSNERELEFKNQHLQTEINNFNQMLIEEKVGDCCYALRDLSIVTSFSILLGG